MSLTKRAFKLPYTGEGKFGLKDQVAYNKLFVRRMAYDKEVADKRGTVVAVAEPFVTVQWLDEDNPVRVHENNLCHVLSTGQLVDAE